MERMKIAVATGGHIPSLRAHSIAVMKMADGFRKLGHDVEILTVERFLEVSLKRKIKDLHDFYGISHNVRIIYFKDSMFYLEEVFPFNYFFRFLDKITTKRIRDIADPEKRISEYCKSRRFDLCYYRGYGRAAYYNVVNNKIPTIMESHVRNIMTPDLKRVIKISRLEYFKGLVTISEKLKRNFIRAGVPEEKILVLHSGVDLERFRSLPSIEDSRRILNLPLDRKLVVYVGSLFPEKGIKDILLVAEQIPQALFILVGGEPKYVKHWRKYAISRGIRNVKFTGFVNNSLVPLYLSAADALIMPYGRECARIMDIESTSPLKLFEYMAAKKPIISTKIPAIQRIIHHGVEGLLAEPENIEQLTEYVRIALEDLKLAKKLGEQAHEKVKAYEWSERCRKILEKFCS